MLDRIMALLSSFDAWVVPMLLLIAVLLWRGGFRGRAFVLCAGFIVGIKALKEHEGVKHYDVHWAPRGVEMRVTGNHTQGGITCAGVVKIKIARGAFSSPGAADFCYCGNAPVEGLPYCAGHARIAYRGTGRRYASVGA